MKQKHNGKFSDKELIQLYEKHKNLNILSVLLNVPDITIFRRATKLGLIFKNGGNRGHFKLIDILNGMHPQYPTLKLKNRLIKEGNKENKCEVCNISEWLGKPINMHLDHIDGNSHNHKLYNLRMICPNCHSQTETYCGKNKI